MRVTAIAAMALILGATGRAGESDFVLSILDDCEVISALKNAWKISGTGSKGIEAGFRLDGSPSAYKVVTARYTNEFRRQRFEIIPGFTFAVVHVHPSDTSPEPSEHDRMFADRYRFTVVTLHVSGVYEYDPVTKRTRRLCDQPDWKNAVQNCRHVRGWYLAGGKFGPAKQPERQAGVPSSCQGPGWRN